MDTKQTPIETANEWAHWYARTLRPEPMPHNDMPSGARALVWFAIGFAFAMAVVR